MQPKRSQRLRVLDRLLSVGWIDQAYCRRIGITRLATYIGRLRAEGYNILLIKNGQKTKYVIGEP